MCPEAPARWNGGGIRRITLRRLLFALLLALLPLALTACQLAKPTAYGPMTAGSDYGYSQTRLDSQTWRVQVAGNSETSRDLVENQLLYRAAEIAAEAGADGFVLLDRDIERDSESYTTYPLYADPFYAYPYGPFWGGHAFYGARPGYWPGFYGAGFGFNGYTAGVGRTFGRGYAETRTLDRYTAYAEIRLYSGEPPAGSGPAFAASELLANLADTVNRGEAAQ